MKRYLIAISIICLINNFQTYSQVNDIFKKYSKSSSSPYSVNFSHEEERGTGYPSRYIKPPSGLIGFDQQIDENTYILGTGDGFTIYLWGSVNSQISSIIDQEGNCIIPSVGVVNIKNQSLREGREKIREKILGKYKKIEMSIMLTEIRKFKVYVVGHVETPGFYEVNGATRISDLIKIADYTDRDNVASYDINFTYDKPYRYRGIQIDNHNYPIKYADLAIFYHSNIVDKNPYLLEGDRVFVPKRKELLSINGSVNYPGVYAFMPGDTLINALQAAGGLARGADSSQIIVYRFMNDVDSLISNKLSFYDSSVYYYPLQKDDRILVCNIVDYRLHRQVTIYGEVKYPGIYPIRKDKTRIMDVISQAGGFTDDAFLRGSKIVRRKITKFNDREYERLRRLPPEALSPLERSYLKTKEREEQGIVSLDFEELLRDGSKIYDIILRDEDEITIARKNLSLKVMGAVINPGLVSYTDEADIDYYIEQAGGYNELAKKKSITIIKGGSGIWLKPREVERLEAGDAIWVPEEPYKDRLQITKDVLLIVGSIATVIMTGLTVYTIIK